MGKGALQAMVMTGCALIAVNGQPSEKNMKKKGIYRALVPCAGLRGSKKQNTL